MASWGWLFVGMLTMFAGILVYEMGKVRGAMDFAMWMKEKTHDAS